METPANPLSVLRLTPPAKRNIVSVSEGFWIVVITLFAVSALLNGVYLIVIFYTALLAIAVPSLVKRIISLQGHTYEVDESGISFFDAKHPTPTALAWSEIDEVESSKEGVVSLYSRGRGMVVKFSPLHQNYLATMPVLLEKLHPLWREKQQQIYAQTFGLYLLPIILIPLLLVVIGMGVLATDISRAVYSIGVGGYFCCVILSTLWTKVRVIKLNSDSLELVKGNRRETIAAATISGIEFVPDESGKDKPLPCY